MADRIPHVLILPHPAQGHINPSLAFATHLSSINGLKVTFIITTNLHNKATFSSSSSSSLTIHHISDGSEHVSEAETIEAYFARFEAVLSASLADYIDELGSSASPPKLVVYDSTMPWVLEVAKGRDLLGAPFFTQSAASSAVFYHLKLGFLKFPYEDDGEVALPALPPLRSKDLPSLGEFMDENRTVVKVLGDQFLNLEGVDWIFINTFDLLEQEIFYSCLPKFLFGVWRIFLLKTILLSFADRWSEIGVFLLVRMYSRIFVRSDSKH